MTALGGDFHGSRLPDTAARVWVPMKQFSAHNIRYRGEGREMGIWRAA